MVRTSKRTTRRAKRGTCRKNGKRTPTYVSWCAMLFRCSEMAIGKERIYYFDRGIRVCERWLCFDEFLSDMGERPVGTTLDRWPNKNGNYEPGNVRWADKYAQNRNTRKNRIVTFRGKSQTVTEWANELGCNPQTVFQRLRKWSSARAVSVDVAPRNKELVTFRGKSQPVTAWARELGIHYAVLGSRLKRGWSVERALTEPVVHRDLVSAKSAKANGIPVATFHKRKRKGWSTEQAATEPQRRGLALPGAIDRRKSGLRKSRRQNKNGESQEV
jgi:hypothetical protein